jgi:enoyl-CoA hydratase
LPHQWDDFSAPSLLNSWHIAYRSDMTKDTENLLITVENGTACITLDRPKALHALTTTMCHEIHDALSQWWHDDHIRLVLLTATPGRAFCAGGDIREALMMMQAKEAGDKSQPDYFAGEYGMDMLISAYPKPIIAIADGLTMGGGAGLLFNASYALVTENIDFTMPETGIGLFPDVAASLFLRRATGLFGLYIGLTGTRIGHADMLASGLLPGFIASADMGAVMATLKAEADSSGDINAVIRRFLRHDAAGAVIMPHIDWINDMLSLHRLEDVRDAAAVSDHPLAPKLYEALTIRCPISLKLTQRLLTGTPSDSYISALLLDYALAMRMMAYPDFSEGVRAAVIDKDQNPTWSHQKLEEVDDTMLDDLFSQDNRPRFPIPPLVLSSLQHAPI